MVHAPHDGRNDTPRAANPGERNKWKTTSRLGERVRTNNSGGEITRRTKNQSNRQLRHDNPLPTIEENNEEVVTMKGGRTGNAGVTTIKPVPAFTLNGCTSSSCSRAGFQQQSVELDTFVHFSCFACAYLPTNKIINEGIAKSETNSDIQSCIAEDGISPEDFREEPPNFYDNSVQQEDTEELEGQTPVKECGYAGDDENANGAPWDQAKIKVKRKKFGMYPLYRIRINGIPWIVVVTSDEENENGEEDAFRHTETLKKPRRSRSSKAPKPTSNTHTHTRSSSCAESEESEPIAKPQKCTRKRRGTQKKHLEIDTTASEASDAENLDPL